MLAIKTRRLLTPLQKLINAVLLIDGDTVVAPCAVLGEAFLLWDKKGYRTYVSEGGHSGFSRSNQIEIEEEFTRFIQQSEVYVSSESVCSGISLPTIYKFLKTKVSERTPYLPSCIL